MNRQDVWPGGATWVFQGTVAEDATAGTHVCTLTVTPGAGNEIQVLYGEIRVGATATAQGAAAFVDDGTNVLSTFMNPAANTTTTSGLRQPFFRPGIAAPSAGGTPSDSGGTPGIMVSGTMRLVLQVTTTAVSVTQTFAVVCRIRGSLPTATLADTVGTPTLTTNTNKVF